MSDATIVLVLMVGYSAGAALGWHSGYEDGWQDDLVIQAIREEVS